MTISNKSVDKENDMMNSTEMGSIDEFPEEDDWAMVGKEGRGRTTLSRNPEHKSWVDKYFVTEQTRQIEQNLGVY